MALRKIYQQGEPTLRKKAKTVIKFDGRLGQLIDDMKETLINANGIGLAAPQVGVLKRVVLIDAGEDGGVFELINPTIIIRDGEQVYYEGCLSYPGRYGNVGRPQKVKVAASDRKGNPFTIEAEGLYAVACCHETDHLEGEMFMNKVRGRMYSLEEVKELRANASHSGNNESAADIPKSGDNEAGIPKGGDSAADIPNNNADAEANPTSNKSGREGYIRYTY